MVTFNKAQTKALTIAPSITGCISSFASITLIVSIFQSNQRLSTVYRRLVFALSAFDILSSIPQILSSLPMPAGTAWGAIGNDVTCDLQGFLMVIGYCGAFLYSLSLTIYFLLVVKFDMSEAKIKKNVEPLLHAVPILYSVVVSTSIYATNNFNPVGGETPTGCWVAPEPLNCEGDLEAECQSGSRISNAFIWISSGFPIFGVFIGNCTILAVIWWTYHSQTRKNQAYGNTFLQSSPNSQVIQQNDEEEQTDESIKSRCSFCPLLGKCPITKKCSNSRRDTPRTSALAVYLSRPSRTSIRNLEQISKRAAAYVIAYMLANMFSILNRLIRMYGPTGSAPFTIVLLGRLFFPLQGLFNVLVYTYPHVISHRRNDTDCNWFQAFWKVIRTGGDSDQSRSGRANRRGSIRRRERVLAQSEFRRRSGAGANVTPRSINNERGRNNIESLRLNFDATRLDGLDRNLSIEE